MENKAAALFCFVAALAGVAALALAAKSLEPVPKQISELGAEDIGSRVVVSGRISTASWRNGNLFLSVCGAKCIKVVVFASLAEQMRGHSLNPSALEKGAVVSVEGTVDEYRGELEITPFHYNSIDVVQAA
ncbi:MAG: hypothetical protein AB1626_01425 [Candidatus Micrarchaeota archaeon]